MSSPRRPQLSEQDYVNGVLAGNRAVLARAITLVESRAPKHQVLAQRVLTQVLPRAGRSARVGITGVPGVGKSSLIEVLGQRLIAAGHKVAVLAIDPSSPLSRGSILGDKTRMPLLSQDERAFIRPSPAAGTLGGVARATRESMLLVEAAGYDVVLVETVGVGQSEVAVRSMVDFFLLLLLAGAGDELQGIKRGVIELADALCITKSDGENRKAASRAQGEYRRALHFLMPATEGWEVEVLTCSVQTGEGIDGLWQVVERHRALGEKNGGLLARRRQQDRDWMYQLVEEQLRQEFFARPSVQAARSELEAQVERGELPPTVAARRLLES